MKKTKLLNSVVALALVLTLGGCNETEEVYEVTSTDALEVINILNEYGAAVDSWTSVDTLWVTSYDYYDDLSFSGGEGYSYDEQNSYTDIYLAQGKVDGDSSTRLILWLDDYYSYQNLYAVYIEDNAAYQNENGEIKYASDVDDDFYSYYDYCISPLVGLFDGEGGALSDFEGLDDKDNASLKGELQTSNLGATKCSLSLNEDYSDTYDTYTYKAIEQTTLEVNYDSAKELVSVSFTWYGAYIASNGRIYVENETIDYSQLEGDVSVPSWVSSFNG